MGQYRQIFTERVQTLGSRLEVSHAPSFADGKMRRVQTAPRGAGLWSAGSCTACTIPYLGTDRQNRRDLNSQPSLFSLAVKEVDLAAEGL